MVQLNPTADKNLPLPKDRGKCVPFDYRQFSFEEKYFYFVFYGNVLILGYDHTEKKVRIGPLAENTHPEIRDKIEEMLTESHDMTPKDAKEVVDHTWKDTPDDMKIKCTANLPELFSRLKKQGVKVRPFESQLL